MAALHTAGPGIWGLQLHPDRILFVTSEMDDFVRVGGLAAVSAALPRALAPVCDIRVLVPGYPGVLARAGDLDIVGHCAAFAALPACRIGRCRTPDGLTVYVALCPELYDRAGSPYTDDNGVDWADNDIRFARLAAAAVDLAAGVADPTWMADLVHANDWESALAPAYISWRKLDIPSILTVHNLAYQGLFSPGTMERIGAPREAFHIDGIEFYDKVSFMKAGLVYASHVTTVSETYAREITTPEFGCGLDGVLRQRAQRQELTGIINGIDASWDARTCPDLYSPFDVGQWKGKRANSDHLRRSFGLALSDGPLFGLVARLVHQKGVDLVLPVAEAIVQAGGQIVVMGTGEKRFEEALSDAGRRHPGSIAVTIGFDDAEARRVFAGSDFTLMPSRFEPCGLSQMYAQKFGSLPIGHRIGGLAETIDDGKTGFLFGQATVEHFFGAVCRAFSTFGSKPHLNSMRRQAMEKVFSWKDSAASYAGLYREQFAFRR
jgi:starch synthase